MIKGKRKEKKHKKTSKKPAEAPNAYRVWIRIGKSRSDVENKFLSKKVSRSLFITCQRLSALLREVFPCQLNIFRDRMIPSSGIKFYDGIWKNTDEKIKGIKLL